MLIIRRHEVRDVLAGHEHAVVETVRRAYLLHHEGRSALPHSAFLRFPGDSANRIIALPAYLGGDVDAAGVKWVASFPGNRELGLERANAVIVLNSTETGVPEAVIEASLISAARTAASAALAAFTLSPEPGVATGLSLIGCGVINLAVLKYVKALHPDLSELSIHDVDPARAATFATLCREQAPGLTVRVADDHEAALEAHELISIATTALAPHLELAPPAKDKPANDKNDKTVLHVSLRDLTPGSILAHHNVVDDADHVCREQTSLHLAEQLAGDRGFIDAPLAEYLAEGKPFARQQGKAVVFSPFGLGVLDIGVARIVYEECLGRGLGIEIPDF